MTSATWDLAALATLVTAIAGALSLLARFLARTRDGQDEGNSLLRELTGGVDSLRQDIGGIRKEMRRLAQVDTDDRVREDDNHLRLWAELGHHDSRIEHVERHLGLIHDTEQEQENE